MAEDAVGPSGHEPWAIRLAGDEAVREAGQNLREWAGDDRGRLQRFVDRVTLRDEQDPKLAGARGEALVAKELARLDGGWTVVHGVRLGSTADVDHLVVGPPGVFSLNTKRIGFEARVQVSARRFRVNGYSRDYYPKAVREAERVADRLEAATGLDVAVRPLIVLTGVDRKNVQVREQPADVTVLLRRELCRWLQGCPAAFVPDAVKRLSDALRRPSTWDPSKVAVVLDRVPPTAVPVPEPPPATTAPAAQALAVKVVEWRRYGHHRRYVNDARTGARLGWRDERDGSVHVEEGVDPTIVHDALGSAG